jgi:hypothetical protein
VVETASNVVLVEGTEVSLLGRGAAVQVAAVRQGRWCGVVKMVGVVAGDEIQVREEGGRKMSAVAKGAQ